MSQATLSDRPYLNSNLFSSHYLDERVRERNEWDCDEAAREVMGELGSLYENERGLVEGYNEDPLIQNWIDEVLDVLGFGTQVETTLPGGGGYVDVLLFENDAARRDAAERYLSSENTTDLFEGSIGLLEAKQWEADFTKRFAEERPYRNASHQIKHYLERTPENVQWGILTNGRKWRLYGTKDYETQTYYEVDLPALLERGDLEAFKYFYVFFRPEAFRDSAGTTFLDTVWSESETASQELGEDLQDNVFTALRVLGRGFVETNDLEIDPVDDDALDELKEQSLVLLYRLMFVLYAEARGLIHPEGREAREEYEEDFSLDALRSEIHDAIGEVDEGFAKEFSEHSTRMWGRLQDLFRLIDEGEASLGIPPYNGGLFDREKHAFLTDHEVSNRSLAEVIYRLSTTRSDEGRYVLADYADLDTRHLGSVYEGLLEHQFRIAPEEYAAVSEDGGQVWKSAEEVTVADAVETVPEGGLYVVNDEGERKATGAYYTPDYVVTYIVEETVGPLVNEIREDLVDQGFERGTQEYLGPFLRRVTDLTILDPAMGSGHFLTKATGYLAEEVMGEVRDVEVETGVDWDERYVRREIAKECIYGVDVNGMAVELAKLSMWLETLSADRPLAFLDHHFKTGNSLVGSDIEAIEGLESDASNGDDEQSSLATFGATREGTIERLMEIYGEFLAIENEDLDDVKRMERKYAEIREDDLRQRLVAMANVRTAEDFGLDVSTEGDRNPYEWMASALESDAEWAGVTERDWFRSAQAMAEEHGFFHWKLEFPEVFYNEDGSEAERSGFGSVVGNPPYVRIQSISGNSPELASYYSNSYLSASGKYDLYVLFVEAGLSILSNAGNSGMILPNKFVQSGYGTQLRSRLLEENSLWRMVDFGHEQVFDGLSTYTSLLLLSYRQTEFQYAKASPERLSDLNFHRVSTETLSEKPWIIATGDEADLLAQLRAYNITLADVSEEIYQGVITGGDEYFILEEARRSDDTDTKTVKQRSGTQTYKIEKDLLKPFMKGDGIRRFHIDQRDTYLFYPYDSEDGLISESVLGQQYPNAAEYLDEHRDELESRGSESMEYPEWYALWNPREPWKFESNKVITPVIASRGRFHSDEGGIYFNGSGGGGGGGYGIILKDSVKVAQAAVTAILNSSLSDFFIRYTSSIFEGGYYAYNKQYIREIPLHIDGVHHTLDTIPEELSNERPDGESTITIGSALETCVGSYSDAAASRQEINLHLPDYLTNYDDGPTLADLASPSPGVSETLLTKTTEDAERYEKLRIDSVKIDRDGDDLTLSVVSYVKPVESRRDEYGTNSHGYATLDPVPAMEFRDLDASQADLIESFVPYAVDEAGGCAGFRDGATKTITPLDRLRALTLPALADVRDGLADYRDAVSRAEELDEKIERTDALIDEIVYELYGLTDEEIEIVEEAVSD